VRKQNCWSGVLIFSRNYSCDRSLTIGQMQGKFQMVVVRHTGHAIQVCTSRVFLHSLCCFWFSLTICNLITWFPIFLGRCTWWICNSDCQLHFSEPNRPSWSWGISHGDFFTTVPIVLILLWHLWEGFSVIIRMFLFLLWGTSVGIINLNLVESIGFWSQEGWDMVRIKYVFWSNWKIRSNWVECHHYFLKCIYMALEGVNQGS